MIARVSTTSRSRRAWRQGDPWTVTDASRALRDRSLGQGLLLHRRRTATSASTRPRIPSASIDLKQLVDHLQLRGIGLPILIRFRDILRQRLADIHGAFQAAIAQHQYEGKYFCVYPIKVNQQRQVVEEVLDFGRPYDFGLEAGSKPELLAVDRDGRRTTRRSSATASRTPSSSRWRCWPRRWAGASSRSSRNTPSSA